MKTFFTLILILTIAAIGWFAFFGDADDGAPSEPQNGNSNQGTVFASETFDFSLRYPAEDWSTHIDTELEISPKFNAYLKPQGAPLSLPLDHFANVTNVSVFPKGIPTEGIFSDRTDIPFSLNFDIDTEASSLFILEDGTPFAAFIKPTAPPASWGDAGFIWARVRIENLSATCIDKDTAEAVPEGSCDPLTENHTIIRSGIVSEEAWDTAERILKSITLEE